MSKQIQKPVVRLVVDTNQELLIVKRSSDLERPEQWELPGGKVDFGETFEEAGARELYEETGIEAGNLVFYDTFSDVRDNVQAVGVVLKAPLAVIPEISLSDEHEQYAWIGQNTWKKYEYSTTLTKLLSNYFTSKTKDKDDKKTTESQLGSDEVIIFADGGSRGNPGPSATGYAIFDGNESEIARGGEYIGITTNNQAEYLAVKQGLQRALEMGAQKVQFYLDSMLVVNQMKGIYKVKNKDLWPVHESIKQMSRDIDIKFEHVRREKNKVADSIVNEVLDQREEEQ